MKKENKIELERMVKKYIKDLERNILCDIEAIYDLEKEE
jgi:hypothetical protein